MKLNSLISARIAKGAAVLAVSLAAVMAGSGSADATVTSTHNFENASTRRCMDDSQAYGLRPIGCNGGPYQQWTAPDWWTTGKVVNSVTSNCLDDSLAYGLRAIPCNGSNFQYWHRYMVADGNTRISNSATGRCLDDSIDGGLRAFPCNELEWQGWFYF
ncbi:actinohivin [Kitasatospora sp. NPDC058184]|uniref:RICIN domain-containing protein n=1 Tax=Kitasatospora sp. NPDC058184 TaxID=3346370 RepID=UPI0036D7F4B6